MVIAAAAISARELLFMVVVVGFAAVAFPVLEFASATPVSAVVDVFCLLLDLGLNPNMAENSDSIGFESVR